MKRVALVTGASSGIGKELARLHASNVSRFSDSFNLKIHFKGPTHVCQNDF